MRVTGYRGHEQDILALRNANRESAQFTEYLDWRYLGPAQRTGSEVLWLDTAQGMAAGMAALIQRAYWIDGAPAQIGVLGDISLNEMFRGKGLGKLLLSAMTVHCEQSHAGRTGFVIPTEAARRSLAAAGWSTGGLLIPHVMLLNPAVKMQPHCGSLARPLAAGYRLAIRTWLGWTRRRVDRLDYPVDFAADFDAFWQAFPKQGLCLADRSAATLKWRYTCHPHQRFRIASLNDGDRLVGYLVFECGEDSCFIYDVLARSVHALQRMIAPFVLQMMQEGLCSIRIMLNDAHPYRRVFTRMGFFARPDSAVFQLLRPPVAMRGALTWMLTQGDKDI